MVAALPGFRGGLARSAGESAYPQLWKGLMSCWAPALRPISLVTATAPALFDFGQRKRHGRNVGATNVTSPFGAGLQSSGGTGTNLVAPVSADAYDFVHQQAVYTIVSVFRTETPSTFSALLDNVGGNSGRTGFIWYYGISNKLSISVVRGSNGNTVVAQSSASSLAAGAWYVAVATCDGATGRLYLNGRRDGSDAAVGTLGSGIAGFDLGICGYGGGLNQNCHSGVAALHAIWNRPLTAGAIRLLSADPLVLFRPSAEEAGRRPDFRSWFGAANHLSLGGTL